MSLNTFDKTQTQYERKLAREKQLEMMEAAASGRPHPGYEIAQDVSPSGSAHSAPPAGKHAPPEGAIESARRFLWDEDEDEYGPPAGRNFAGQAKEGADQHSNLMGVNVSGSYDRSTDRDGLMNRSSGAHSGIGSRVVGFVGSLPRFKAKTGVDPQEKAPVNLAPRRQSVWHSDAAAATESEEYLEDVELHGRRPGGASSIGDCCTAFFHTLVGACAIMSECFTSCCSGFSKKQCCILITGAAGLSLLIFSIIAIVKRAGGGDSSDSAAAANIQDPVRYDAIYNVVLESYFTDAAHLDTPGTAQNLAIRWLTDDDPGRLSPDDDDLLQRYALATFFFSTYVRTEFREATNATEDEQQEWNNMEYWMTDKGICMWYGVYCAPHLHNGAEVIHYNENNDVIQLNLTDNNIRGTIPSEIIALENLVSLDLGKNQLSGPVPTNFNKFQFLTELYLQENELSGPIPTEIGLMTKLRDLFLGTNRIVGTIPTEIAELTELRALGLDENYLTGSIPYIWPLRKLIILYLDANQLTGTVHYEIKYLKELADLRLRQNNLNGTIPYDFNQLLKLELLYLDDNDFTGTIPEIFDSLRRLEEIQLYKNKLTGTLPTTIETLDDLKVLYMDNNDLFGSVPPGYGNLRDLRVMYLFNNQLGGSLPKSLGNMEDMLDLQLQNNQFTGSIPTELANLFKLEKLELQDNQFIGGVPTEFGSLEHLQSMKVFRNQLSGSMPKTVCDLRDSFDLRFLASDCDSKESGLYDCDCCDACYP